MALLRLAGKVNCPVSADLGTAVDYSLAQGEGIIARKFRWKGSGERLG